MAYQIGQIVEGKVTGIQPYGAFVALDGHTDGLIHISEISDGYVKDISRFVAPGDTICVKIIDYDPHTHQARLSLKALRHIHARNRRRPQIRNAALPPMRLGFMSIAAHMEQWLKEAEEEEKDNDSI